MYYIVVAYEQSKFKIGSIYCITSELLEDHSLSHVTGGKLRGAIIQAQVQNLNIRRVIRIVDFVDYCIFDICSD